MKFHVRQQPRHDNDGGRTTWGIYIGNRLVEGRFVSRRNAESMAAHYARIHTNTTVR